MLDVNTHTHRKGHFMVDLSKPGHLTACLTEFRVSIGATLDNWDAAFQVGVQACLGMCVRGSVFESSSSSCE